MLIRPSALRSGQGIDEFNGAGEGSVTEMNMMKWTTGAALLMCVVPALSQAESNANVEKNPLSVHVLNTQTGMPSSGVEVMLEQKTDSGWKTLATQTTNADGRTLT